MVEKQNEYTLLSIVLGQPFSVVDVEMSDKKI